MKRWGAAAALALLVAGCGSTEKSAAPQGTTPVTGKTGQVRFSRDLGSGVVAGPIIAEDGTVLAASSGGILRSLDAATGKELWKFDGGGSYGSDLSTSPLQLPDGTILWTGPRDRVFAVSPEGRQLWSVELGATGTTPARGRNGRVYIQDIGGTLHALDASAKAGRERWKLPVGSGTSYGSVALSPTGRIYTTVGSALLAVDDRGAGGKPAWTFAAKADIEVSPAVGADGTVVLGTNDAFQYGISPEGKERWRWRREVFTYSSPVTTPDGLVRFGDHRGRLVTLDAATGKVKQIVKGLGQVWGKPAVAADGTVAFSGHPGNVFLVDKAGKTIARVKTGGLIDSSPVFGPDGTAYIGSDDGKLYAITP